MSKTQVLEAINVATQVVPFLMITAMLITVSYAYAHTVTLASTENPITIAHLL